MTDNDVLVWNSFLKVYKKTIEQVAWLVSGAKIHDERIKALEERIRNLERSKINE